MKSAVLRGWIRGLSHISKAFRRKQTKRNPWNSWFISGLLPFSERLLSTQTDNGEARRERLLKLLADEEPKGIVSSQHDVSPRSALMNPR
jgi:hypothetical protein